MELGGLLWLLRGKPSMLSTPIMHSVGVMPTMRIVHVVPSMPSVPVALVPPQLPPLCGVPGGRRLVP